MHWQKESNAIKKNLQRTKVLEVRTITAEMKSSICELENEIKDI